jgi:muramoyltetrapeptide carboxypeptidase
MTSPSDGAPTRAPDPPLRPRALRLGSRIALVAPAGPLLPDRIRAAEQRCRILGFDPVVGRRSHGRWGFFSGPDADRLADLQSAFDDPSVDAVWALRGGWGTARIVDDLDLSRQLQDPIPFMGFSDNTALHARHAALGVISFHAPHPEFDTPVSLDPWLRRVTSHPGVIGALPPSSAPSVPLLPGRATGRLTGGNLSIVASLCGTRDQIRAEGCILLLEDVGEPAYRIDRLLVQLRRAGVLDGVAGLAFGAFSGISPDEAGRVRSTLAGAAEAVGVPALLGLPFGHTALNHAIPLGVEATLDADGGSLILNEAAVRSCTVR